MDNGTYKHCTTLLQNGAFEALQEILRPLLQAGDPDAQYLNLMFSLSETGEEFDARRVKGLQDLARHGHKRAIFDLAWLYRHGDDGLAQDELKFLQLLTASSLMGGTEAAELLKAYLAAQLNWDSFPETG
ncbi:hypothetical protein [Leisingera sp. ANG-Vp]|uniref:hypothetical protein n=1 Tax=Leisingera sp. ANG-Vp TaxID=1577896 RepID=UPI0005800863|nr:hypothetical protein [Leisingera sp. ANG-Vp]KIC15162.1 hypothetical protein RA20_18555 [Leisingera sp. ANG-Vp]